MTVDGRPFAPWLALLVFACAHPAPPTPLAIAAAPFVATSPNNSRMPPRNECWMSGRFEGTAYLRGNELELEIPHAWIAVTRDNDKEWDDLHLAVEVSRHPLGDTAWFSLKSIPVVLRPTVDSAGPQLTTWETQDTLRLIVPWQHSLGPRWLIFALDYRTLSHAGGRGACGGRLGTDTLRFSSRGR